MKVTAMLAVGSIKFLTKEVGIRQAACRSGYMKHNLDTAVCSLVIVCDRDRKAR